MKRFTVNLCFLALSLAWSLCETRSEGAGQPNIILIMADDVGRECFGCYGSEQYRTPNIDRMADEGMRFQHCYSQPLCTPSRVKIMTGISNVRNYAGFSILRKDQKTFGHYLQEEGYATAVVGKWQLYGAEHYSHEFRGKGTLPQDAGFDFHCLWQVDKLGDRFWDPVLTIDGELKKFGKDDYGPDLVTNYLEQFMENQSKSGKPFFAYYPMILVHSPFVPTPGSDSRESRDKQRNFEDMVTHMDEIVGRLVRKTEDLGIAENTVILFTGDNGTHKAITSRLGDRVIQGGKGKMDDTGTRVPLVAYWPGTIQPGLVSDVLVDFSDFLPSFLHLSGGVIPADFDGRSFVPELRGEAGNPRTWIYCYYCPRPESSKPQCFARDQRWKLYGDGRLYDLSKDPVEKQPLDPKQNGAAYRKLKGALDSMPPEGQVLLQWE